MTPHAAGTAMPRQTILLLCIAGLGGLLYGIDVGIIAGALPYLEATAIAQWHLSTQQLGFVVAAVLLGSVLSSLFAGALADWFGRKPMMAVAGLLFVLSIPIIAMSAGYWPLLLGRLLQGLSGGLIGVVVPLYLAESLDARYRGRGTALFQLFLTAGLLAAALIGLYYARQVEAASANASAAALFAVRNQAWRDIFWMCLPPGLVFTAGTLLLPESPRWLAGHGTAVPEVAPAADGAASLFSRRYVLPFLLACVILACNQATGINSILAYSVNILTQAGLPGAIANQGDVVIKLLNVLMTVAAIALVDRKGRKFLLMLGSGGIVAALACAGLLFLSAESTGQDVRASLQARIQGDELVVEKDDALFAAAGTGPRQLVVAYAYGDFANVQVRRSDDAAAGAIRITRADTVQEDSIIGRAFRAVHLNPFADPASAAKAPLRIERAELLQVPNEPHGWLVALCLLAFVAFFAIGPGVCVWLALSELMPTRIRSNGMSIALLVNQFVSTLIAAIFLPTVGGHGYAPMFFVWAGCTVVYFLAATFWLPETKGRTLEEIEQQFRGRQNS